MYIYDISYMHTLSTYMITHIKVYRHMCITYNINNCAYVHIYIYTYVSTYIHVYLSTHSIHPYVYQHIYRHKIDTYM